MGMSMSRRSATDQLLSNNDSYAASLGGGSLTSLPMKPSRSIAVVACMDSRLDLSRMLGLEAGDAHVLRNAGGVVTDDVILPRHLPAHGGSSEIMLIHHTDCGMLGFTDDSMKRQIQDETGVKPSFSMESFSDLDEDVLQSMSRIRQSPFLLHRNVRGFVLELSRGRLREVHQVIDVQERASASSSSR